MKKLFVVTTHCVKLDENHKVKPDPDHVEELPIRFDQAYLYYANDENDAIDKRRKSIYGRDFPVSAREFTDEEYKKAFEKSTSRKVEWLIENLALGEHDDTFDKLNNKKLEKLVRTVSNRLNIPVTYK